MKISSQFNRFFHGVVCPQLKQGAIDKFIRTGKGMGYVNPYTQERYYFDMRKVSDESVYLFLKLVNPNYPRDESGLAPASTTEIDTETMTKHIMWIERWAGLNGLEMQYVVDQWEELLTQAGIKNKKEK